MSAPRPAIDGHNRLVRVIADASYGVLRLSGWIATTVLATLGVATLFFLMIGDFTALGFFSQLDNLAARFVAADEMRRAAFTGQLRFVAVAVFIVVAVARWRPLLAILLPWKVDRHD